MTQKLPEPMLRAFTEAEKAAERGEVPVGAVITDKLGNILAVAGNRTLADHDPTAHAEMLAIREVAAKLGSERLIDCDLYVTLEPCAMCAGAMVHARVKRLVFAATDPRAGAAGSIFNVVRHDALNHRLHCDSGVLGEECSALLRGFFLARRA